MEVYRITLAKWADKLQGSGRAARWNSQGKFIIYTASSRALSCLENIVHRSGEGLKHDFRMMTIAIPDEIRPEVVDQEDLQHDWRTYRNYHLTQAIGDKWKVEGASCIIKVPSAIIPEEYNYLINPDHKDFTRIKLVSADRFVFDERII